MPRARMHPDEVVTDVALVGRLLADQLPHWAGLPVRPVASYGTDHDIYRLGDRLAARLPRIGWATDQAAKEASWLPRLAPHLPLAVPVQRARGGPGHGYPFEWSVYEWLPGEDVSGGVVDLDRAAADLAAFVVALRSASTAGAPARAPGGRGGRLVEADEHVRRAVAELGDRVDAAAVLRCWQQALEAPAWTGPQTWLHGDLLPGNLLAVAGRLSAVIDFGSLTVGDPAGDLLTAWNVFSGTARARFLSELAVDEASWSRGRGWTLLQAVLALPYYWDSNDGIVRQASRALREVLHDSPG